MTKNKAILESFGVTGEMLPGQTPESNYIKPVQGRVAHIDADFMSYQASAETKDELNGLKPRKTLAQMKDRTVNGLKHLMLQCGATDYVAHITPSASDKGGRNDLAVTRPYQANRADKARPEHLDAIRAFIGEELQSIVHMDQEADDGMTQANVEAIARGERELSIIVSKDKDLRMAPGLHWDFDEEEVVDVVDPFGSIWVDRSKSSAKVLGWGTKFFWCQTLMGDTADNIKGCPNFVDPKAAKSAPKAKACGAIAAFNLLQHAKTDAECFEIVKRTWASSTYEWVHHYDQSPTTWQKALVGDMELLWMRQKKGQSVLDWLKTVV